MVELEGRVPLVIDFRDAAVVPSLFDATEATLGPAPCCWPSTPPATGLEARGGGPMGFPGEVSYGAAKAALESYTMSASTEPAPLGITDTGWVTDDGRAFVAATPDHHHVATADGVAEVIAWPCAPAADLVTGNVIRLR